MSRRSLAILLSAVLLSALCYSRNAQDPHARYLAEAYEQIDHHALFEPGDQALVEGAMRGMVDVLRRRGDQHSGYSDPSDAERFMAEIRQEFGGVGVRIRFQGEPPRLTLVGPPEPNTPASRAGLRAGDRIDAIDGAPTDELDMNQALDMMRGPVGEPVTLTISRGDDPRGNEPTDEAPYSSPAEPITVTLVRAEIEVPSVVGDRRQPDGEWRYTLEADPRIALLRVNSFGNKTFHELQTLLPVLLAEGVEAFVFDLRNNPGGALDVAIDVCDLFLTPGRPIVETRGRHNRVLSRFRSRGGPYVDLPLAVLINRDSASAAEIMAACFQDNRRAVVVGERSFGKGTVQQLLPTESGRTLLKLTIASYWRPSGANIHRMPEADEQDEWGVRPDEGFAVPMTNEQFLAWRIGRSARDITVIQQKDAVTSDDAAESPVAWRDAVLDRAVAHLLDRLEG